LVGTRKGRGRGRIEVIHVEAIEVDRDRTNKDLIEPEKRGGKGTKGKARPGTPETCDSEVGGQFGY